MLLDLKNRLIKSLLDLTLLIKFFLDLTSQIKLSLNLKLLSESLLNLRLSRRSLNSPLELLRLIYLRLKRRS